MKQKHYNLTPQDLQEGDVICFPNGAMWPFHEHRSGQVHFEGNFTDFTIPWGAVATLLSLEGVYVEREGPTVFEGVVKASWSENMSEYVTILMGSNVRLLPGHEVEVRIKE